MIHDLSLVLRRILNDPNLPEPLRTAQKAFDRPTEPYNPGPSTVNLFLYDVRENAELRDNEPVIQRQGGQVVIRQPPMRVACSYLVTAWPAGAAGEALVLQEHQLLSQALQALARHPTIPASFLQGSLAGQEPPLPMMTAQMDGLKNPAEFWTAVGNKLRASFAVTVTIAMDVLAPETAPMVITERVSLEQQGLPATRETFFRIGGQVTTTVHSGVAQGGMAGPPPAITLANPASTTDDFYNGMQIEITGGAGSGQIRLITDYAGATRVAMVNSNWTTAPDNTSAYAVNTPVVGALVTLVERGLTATTGADGRYTLGPISPGGPHTLRVQKDAATREVGITVPAPAGSDYNVKL